MLAAIVWWGISLNLTIGLVFYGIFPKTSINFNDYPYYSRDLQIFAATGIVLIENYSCFVVYAKEKSKKKISNS